MSVGKAHARTRRREMARVGGAGSGGAGSGGAERASSSLQYLLTTNAGLEEMVKAELLQAGVALSPPISEEDVEMCPFGCPGRVLVRRPWNEGCSADGGGGGSSGGGSGGAALVEPAVERVLQSLRSIHDALWHHTVLPLPEAADPPLALYDLIRALPLGDGGPVPPLLGGRRSFRVSCVREAEQPTPFTSLDIEREVGGALHESYGAPAEMKSFELRVRVDVSRTTVLIGTALNREPLSRRHKLAFTRSVTLKPTVAYALLQLAGLCDGQSRGGGGGGGGDGGGGGGGGGGDKLGRSAPVVRCSVGSASGRGASAGSAQLFQDGGTAFDQYSAPSGSAREAAHNVQNPAHGACSGEGEGDGTSRTGSYTDVIGGMIRVNTEYSL